MIAESRFGGPSFNLVAKELIELHRLIKIDKEDSAEAESIRDALDAPLKALNAMEKTRAQWLSEDLYSVSEPTPETVHQQQMTSEAQRHLNEVSDARRNGEWDKALELLRKWSAYVLPAQLSYLRGAVWSEAGNLDVAAEFYGHAAESDPENAVYRALYMHALAQSKPHAAAEEARKVLADVERWPPVVVAQAADIRFHEISDASDPQSTNVRSELIPILKRNLERLEEDQQATSRVSAYATTAALLGLCHEFLEDLGAAVEYYSRGLQWKPNEDGLLVARGVLLYGKEAHAIADLEQATSLESPLTWPYFFLAHHYLITSQFERCRVMCEAGLKRRASDQTKSQLEEWRAIAQSELGFSREAVRAAFEMAIRLDPTNELAKRNLNAFEEYSRAIRSPSRATWEQKSTEDVRWFGLVERRCTFSFAA
jgi:tetratricopeptide (TPR) repeat protein